MPTLYLPHGGGPWHVMEPGGFFSAQEKKALADYLQGIPAQLPARPTALLVISAHWETPAPTVMTHPSPPLYFDYYGFPKQTYQLSWPAPGEPGLAARTRALLEGAGVPTAADAERGFDHGTFVPLMLSFPAADVPTVQLSLQAGLDPGRHIALGRALAPLREEGVLIIGSGMSFHNMRLFGRPEAGTVSDTFDAWLREAAAAEPAARDAQLTRWAGAPSARAAHPREEHLLPLMVVAGAAGDDRGRLAYSDTFAGARISAWHFGG